MRVVHVEGGRHLYGGAQQVLYLLRGLHRHGIASALVCPAGSALAAAAAPHAEVFALPMGGDLDGRLVWRIHRILRRFGGDLLHLHSRIGADTWGALAGRWAGVPVVHSRRVDNPEPRWVVALKYRLHDRVIAISEGIRQVLLAEGLPAAKLRLVRSAVDIAQIPAACRRPPVCARLGVLPSARLVGVAAQLIPRKGHRFLVEALAPVCKDFPELQVLFFGQGPEAANLNRQIRQAGLESRVRLCGFRDDLPEILPCLEVLVHPALREGLGVALLQAASAGVPVIASRVGGIPEAVRDGHTGLLVPPGEVAALRAALVRLLRDPLLGRRLGQAGRRRMRAHFSPEVMVAGNLAVYRELLSEALPPKSSD